MPNRIIKESIRTSKSINGLTDSEFRLWVYLITYVDDYGRGSADPELIKGQVFTRRKGITEKQISDVISSLANKHIINLYCVDGESYFYFPNWDKHQAIRAKKSKFPAPVEHVQSDERNCMQLHADEINCDQMQSDDCNCSRNTIQYNPNPNTESEYKEKNISANADISKKKLLTPTVEEINAYCLERKNDVDAQRFYDYYSRQGWKLSNGLPMKDWKACVRTWESRNKRNGVEKATGHIDNYGNAADNYADMKKFLEELK